MQIGASGPCGNGNGNGSVVKRSTSGLGGQRSRSPEAKIGQTCERDISKTDLNCCKLAQVGHGARVWDDQLQGPGGQSSRSHKAEVNLETWRRHHCRPPSVEYSFSSLQSSRRWCNPDRLIPDSWFYKDVQLQFASVVIVWYVQEVNDRVTADIGSVMNLEQTTSAPHRSC